MQKVKVEIATTREQLDNCFKVRYQVFGNELGWKSYNLSNYPSERECDGFDCLGTTINLLGTANEKPAGTVRLLLPNKHIADLHGWKYGLPMEQSYVLDTPVGENKLGELPRSSVIKEYRGGSWLALALWTLAYEIALQNDLTHLVAITNTETDFEGSSQLYSMLQKNNSVEKTFKIQLKENEIKSSEKNNYKNGTEDKFSAPKNLPSSIRIPAALNLYLKAGCKLAGRPAYDEKYQRYVVPIVWPIAYMGEKQKNLLKRVLKMSAEKSSFVA